MQGLGPLIFGGGLRGGSPNIPGIHAMYRTLTQQRRPSMKKINTIHKLFMKTLKKHQHVYLPIGGVSAEDTSAENISTKDIPVEGPKGLPGYILFSVGRRAEELQKKIFTKFNIKVGRIVDLQEILFRIKIPQKYWETLLFIQLRDNLTKEDIKRVMVVLMHLDTITPRGSLPPPSYSSSFS